MVNKRNSAINVDRQMVRMRIDIINKNSPSSYVISKFLDIQISDNNYIVVFKSISNTI